MSEVSPGHRPQTKKTAKTKRSPHAPRAARKRTKKDVDPAKTGRALRQQFTKVTEADLAWLLEPSATGPDAKVINGPGVEDPEGTGGGEETHDLFDDLYTKFEDPVVAAVFDAVRHSGVVALVEDRINATKLKSGRPSAVPVRALIVAMMLTAMDGKGCLCSQIAATLYRRLYPTSMRLLDIEPLPEATTNLARLRQQWRTEKRVRDALRRMLTVLDPSIHPKGKSMPWEELRKLDRDLTAEEIDERHQALSVVCNQILRTPFELLPAKIRRRYEGSACIDATPLRVHSAGKAVDGLIAPTDPDASYYGRGGSHNEDGTPTFKKAFNAYDINLIVAVDDTPGPFQWLPALPLAMHLDRPGVTPAEAAVWMFKRLKEAGHQPKYLAGDGLYANADPQMFHLPARAAGWKLVLPVLDDHLGTQASMEGLLLIEGHWYCPSIPETLINATRAYRDAITVIAATRYKPEGTDAERRTARQQAQDEARSLYQAAIAARVPYRTRFKASNDSGTQRWACGASGSNPSVICANKPKSEEKKMIGGPVLGVRLKDRIYPDSATQTNGVWPKPCRQDSVTIDFNVPDLATSTKAATRSQAERDAASALAAARYTQDLVFGTDEHTDTYNRLRQSQEGLHGFAKDDGYEALGTSGKRRVRGLAAQSLFAAFLLAAASVRKIRSFMLRAKNTDEENNTGDWYVTRTTREGEHATTHLPPGTTGTRGDPTYDHLDDPPPVVEVALTA